MKKTLIGIIIIVIMGIIYFSTIPKEEKSEALIIEKSLSMLYNIPDADEFDEYSNTKEFGKNSKKFDSMIKEYQKMFSENGFHKIVGDRLHLLYRKVAKTEQFTVELKNTDIDKIWVKEKDGSVLNKYNTIGYEYKVELLIEYVNSDETETIYEDGNIYLVEIDGEWKVDFLRYKLLNELFKKSYFKRSISEITASNSLLPKQQVAVGLLLR